MKHVIIGAGAAGIAAAKTIHTLKADDEITLVSVDEQIYSRCMLPRYLSHDHDETSLLFVDSDFLGHPKIKWISGKKVTAINPIRKEIGLEDDRISYDKLLIAAGTEIIIPPINGFGTASNLFCFRHLADAKKIDHYAKKNDTVVIFDSGLVGLDAANALIKRGKKVIVIETADQILPALLDPKSAWEYQKRFEHAGCHFVFNAKPINTIRRGRKISAILMDNGEQIGCDMVILAGNSRPNLDFLKDSSITHGSYIHVDCCMHTNKTDIYAAGDITGLSGIWPNAVEQGKVAGYNMCGMNRGYDEIFSLRTVLNYFGLLTLSLGKVKFTDKEAPLYTTLVREDKNNYKKICLKGNYVVGAILQGDISHSGIWQYLIKNKIDIHEYKDDIFSLSFAHFYETRDDGEYQWSSQKNFEFTYRLGVARL